MSGAETGKRSLAALAFGVGGAASSVPLALFLRGASVWPFGISGAAGALALVLAFGVGGAVAAWRGAWRVVAPAPPLAAGAGGRALPSGVSRGMGVAFRGFALGCALFPVAVALVTLGTTLAAGGAVGAVTVRVAILAVVGQVVGFLAAGAVGSFTVLPLALVLGGAAGGVLGRGRAAPPVG
ncbi:hypothetical protein RQM47_12590 [Rubrivirga sp. S365]|uniref:Major facilitator superfamily (MFS) profile domain-containing protein n=1 Tax=Rubrivirga litoralis TaxID=3075598 RepID=A0ABU3BU23_9BACT|nr:MULTISPECIES: hypothetical protein [unclassified Rubrivirga]MDT0632793.1 hypothetical protein [Rubrivirga sp. F394]MDT7857483.1 hypothetical protein [Rubrivirga sp. S365]